MEQLRNIYGYLISTFCIDRILLADGGYDSLLSGIENELGSPVEEVMTMSSIYSIANKYSIPSFISVLGLHLEHEIDDDDMFKAISRLSANGGLKECIYLNRENDNVRKYMEIVMESNPQYSIINSQIVSALEGNYGDYYHPAIKHRINNVRANLTYLTHTIHLFNLETVIKANKYIHLIENAENDLQVRDIIIEFRSKLRIDFRGKLSRLK
jgi:hypothetical protein